MDQDIDNPFAELGLAPGATEREVKAAWRRLVSQWHPDRNGSAAAVAKMQRINRAVEAIRQAGLDAPPPAAGAGGSGFDPSQEPQSEGDGAGERGDSEIPARTIHRKVRLTLEEAAFGCTRVLRGRVTQACSACEGAGWRVLGGHCPRCQGSGAIQQRAWFGFMGTQIECDACHGGGIARQHCAACAGTGKTSAQRYQVTVRLPHGVRHGDLLSVDGRHGKAGSLPGDLSIRVEVHKHALLRLDKDGTVLCDVPTDGFAWIAGRSIDVPTLDGLQSIRLQRDQICYRLKGQGFPIERRGPRGDQIVTIQPVFPQGLSTDQQILLDQLIATTSGPDAKPSDARLREWNETVRAWKLGRQGRR